MKQFFTLLIIMAATWWPLSMQAQKAPDKRVNITCTPADSAEIVQLLSSGCTSTIAFAQHFIDRPYVAHTLEVNDEEHPVVNTRQLDCTTLVETVVALTLCSAQGKTSFADYTDMLTRLRYRQGIIDRYPSRLHYFSDWIDDNTQLKLVREIQLGGAPFTATQRLNINYMSRHADAYTALKAHPEFIETIAQQERALTGRRYRYIPKSKVGNMPSLRSVVKDGDIIAITCKKSGLDIAHLGFAVWKEDGLHLLNASQIHQKVVLEPMTLRQYLYNHPSHTGIRIIRLNTKQN